MIITPLITNHNFLQLYYRTIRPTAPAYPSFIRSLKPTGTICFRRIFRDKERQSERASIGEGGGRERRRGPFSAPPLSLHVGEAERGKEREEAISQIEKLR